MRKAINAAIIRNKEILLVLKKETWILPGGKPEGGEEDEDCLLRELCEELDGTILTGRLISYGEFSGTTPHTGDELTSIVYFVRASRIGTPSNEITKAEFVSHDRLGEYNISDITSRVLFHLHEDN